MDPKIHENFGALVIYQKLVSSNIFYAAIEGDVSHIRLYGLKNKKIEAD